jgi:hypothetical protein
MANWECPRVSGRQVSMGCDSNSFRISHRSESNSRRSLNQWYHLGGVALLPPELRLVSLSRGSVWPIAGESQSTGRVVPKPPACNAFAEGREGRNRPEMVLGDRVESVCFIPLGDISRLGDRVVGSLRTQIGGMAVVDPERTAGGCRYELESEAARIYTSFMYIRLASEERKCKCQSGETVWPFACPRPS